MGQQLLVRRNFRTTLTYCFISILIVIGSAGFMNPVYAQTVSFTVTSTTGNCSPATINFTDTSTGATSWLWDFGDFKTDTTTNTTEIYSAPGSYTVTLTINGKGNNGISTSQIVNVYPPPNPTIPTKVQGCEPFTGSLTAVSNPVVIAPFKINSSNIGGITGGAAVSYKWDFSGALATQTTSTPVCNLTNVPSGTYNVLLTVTDENGCSGSISVPGVLTVSPLPAVNDISISSCSGSTFSVTPLNGTDGIVPAGTTYSWNSPTGSAFTGGTASVGSPSTIGGTLTNSTDAPVIATYSVTPTAGNCAGSAFNVQVTVNPSGQVNNPGNQVVCNTSGTAAITFATTRTGGVTTYIWTNDTPGIGLAASSGGPAIGIPSFTAINNGTSPITATVTVMPTYTNGTTGCAGTAQSFTITVNPSPTVIATPSAQTICSGFATGIGLSTGTTGGTITYSWTAALTSGTASGFSNGSGNSIAQTLTNNTNSLAVVRYTVTPAIGTCSGTPITVDITVNPTPTVIATPSSQTICSGSATSIGLSTGTTGGTVNYSWTAALTSGTAIGFSNGNGSAITQTLTNNTFSPAVVRYTITPSIGTCLGTPITVDITVNAIPSVLATPSQQTICSGSVTAIGLSTTIGATDTYSWTATLTSGTATGFSNDNGNTISQTLINTTNSPAVVRYTVTPAIAACNGTPITVDITVNPTPTTIATPLSQTICSGTATGIGLSTSTTGGTVTYSWTAVLTSGTATGFSSGSGSSISQILTNNTNSLAVVSYTITPAIGNCGGIPVTVDITVNPSPTVIATPASQTICSSSATGIGLSSTTTGGTVTYSWTAALNSGTATGFSNGSGSTIVQTLTNNTNSLAVVRYTITPVLGTCSGTSITVDITVNPTPTVIATPTQQTICSGSATGIGLSTAITGGTVTYSWTAALNSGTASGFSNGSGPSINQTLTNSSSFPAVVRYTITPSIGTCSGIPFAVDILINPIAKVIATPTQQTICTGSVTGIALTTSVTGVTVTYSWTAALNNGTATGFSNGNGSAITQNLSNNTNSPAIVRYTVTPAIGACSGTPITVDITVNPSPTVIATPISQTICSGSVTGIGLSTNTAGGTVTYSWTAALTSGTAVGFSNGSGNTIAQTLTNNATSPAVVRYTITPALGTCSGTSATIDITVNPSPTVLATPSSQTVCSGSAPAIGLSTVITGVTVNYSWTAALTSGTVSGFSNGSGISIVQTLTNNTNSPAVVRYTVTPAIGTCSGMPITVDITVNPTAQVTNPGNQAGYTNTNTTAVVFTTIRTGGVTTYTWTNDTPGIGLASNSGGTATGIPSFTAINNGTSPVTATLTVTPTFTNGTVGCAGTTQSFTITVNPTGQMTNPGNQVVCNNSGTTAVVFSTSVTGGVTTYTWTDDTPGIGLASSSGGNSTGIPSFTATNSGTSPIIATVTVTPTFTSAGISSTGTSQSFTITVNPTAQVTNPGNQVVCNNSGTSAITFATNRTGGVTSYTWTNDTPGIGLAAGSGGVSTGIPSFTAINNGTSPVTAAITVTPTFTNGTLGCAGNPQSFTITVNPTGQVSNPGNQVVCNNSGTAAITFATNRTGGVTTYTWTNDSPGIGLAVNSGGNSTGIPSFTAINNGTTPITATVTVIPTFTNGATGCAGTAQRFTITVNPTPTVIATPTQQTVCSGSATVIGLSTNTTGATVTYSWTATLNTGTATGFSNGSGSGIAQTLTNNTNSPAVVRYSITPAIGICSGTPITVDITVNPSPTAIATPSAQTVCSGSAPAIGLSTATSGVSVTYSWTAALTSGTASGFSNGNGNAISQPLTNNTNSPAVVRYTITPFIGACSGTPIMADITVNPTAQVTNPGNQAGYNNTNTAAVVFTTTRTGGVTTYSWTNDTPGIGLASNSGGTATGIPSFTAINNGTSPVTATLTVIPTFTNGTVGCIGSTQSFTITVNPSGQMTNPGNQVVCNNSGTTAVIFSTSVTGGVTTYTWTNDTPGIGLAASSGGNSTGIPSFTANNSGASPVMATITVTPTFTTGGSGSTGAPQSFTITVNPTAQVTSPGNQVVYNNTKTAAVVFTTTRNGGVTTYTWTNDTPAIGLASNSGGTSTGIPSFTAINNGSSPVTATLTVTPTFTNGTVGCAGITQSFTITVNPTVQMTNPGNQVVCNNSGTTAVIFSTGVTGGVTTYTWTNDTPGIGLAASSGGNSTGIPSFKATNNGTSPVTATVTVTPTFTSGGISSTGTSQSFTITVNPTGQVTNPGNQVVCNNSGTSAITFSTTRTGGITTYTWTNDTPGIGLAASSGGTTGGIPSFTAINNGSSPVTATITVTPTFTNGATACAGSPQPFTITVNPTGQVTNPGNQVLCNNTGAEAITFATDRTGGVTTYTWTNDTPGIGLAVNSGGNSTGIPSFTVTNNSTAPITATVTVTPTFTNGATGCAGTAQPFTITVNPTPTVIAIPTQQTLCSGSATSIGLSTIIAGGTVTYSWTAALTSGTATGFSNGNGSAISQTLTNNTNSPAVVRYTIIPAIGTCSGTPITVDITVNPLGQVNTPASQVVCNNTPTASITFSTTRTGGATTYTWTNDTPGIGLVASGGGTSTGLPVFTAINSGTLPVTATITVTPTFTNGATGCAGNPQSFTITVNPTGQVNNPGNQVVCNNNGTAAINFATTRTGGITTYNWTNDTPGIGLAANSTGNSSGIPSFTATNNGTSPITATVTITPTFTNGAIGCGGTPKNFTITVNPTPTVVATPTQQTLCSGSATSIGLSTIITGGTVSYTWTAALKSGTATGFSNGSGSPIFQTLTNNTNSPVLVRYTVTPVFGTCSGTPITVDITVNPVPTVSATPNQQTICSGSVTGIGLSTATAGATVTYSWTAALTGGSATGFTNGNGNTIAQTLTNNTSSPAVVRYTITPAINTCSGTPITVDITVNPIPSPVNDFKVLKAAQTLSDNVLTNDGSSLTVKQYVINGITYPAGNTASLTGVGSLSMNASGNYVFTPVPGFVGGVPAITYTVSNTSGCSATATLTITVNTVVIPVAENGSIPATGGTAIDNVAVNDIVNGLPALLGTGGNSTASQSGVWVGGIALVPSTGAVNVAGGTVPGTYSVTYQLCDQLTPETCALMVDQITVLPVITPVTESGTISAIGGTAIANIAANDRVNGLPAVLGTGGNATLSQIGTWPTGITLNPATGAIIVSRGTSQGTYSVSYQLCDLLTPQTCAIMGDQITVTTIIIPLSESGSIPATGGTVIANVVNNDIVNGVAAVLGTGGNCAVSQSGPWPTGITLDPATGAIHVAQGTTPGTYAVSYQLCDLLSPQTCSLMTDQVTVTTVISTVTESGTIPATGGTVISNIVGNDMLNGLAVKIGNGGNSIVSQNGQWPNGITLDPATGAINVAKGTSPGTYQVIYQLCDLLTPQTCALMVDQITVTPLITPVTESGAISPTGGIVIKNITGNDVVNGQPALLGTSSNCIVSQNGSWPVGINLDQITGNVNVAAGTLPGTYSISYQICDLLTPRTCALMVDQVIVSSLVSPVAESGVIPATGGKVISNISGNDMVNGQPALLGTKGNCSISANGTWPVGITLDVATGNVNVARGTTPGTYSVSYQLCDLLTPQSCNTAVDQVTVVPLLTPVKESGTISAAGGVTIANITANDTVNGHSAILGTGGNCAISMNGTWPTGISLDVKTGNIIVANGTVPGTYTVTYQLCDLLTPQTCSLMGDQIVVTPLVSPTTKNGTVTATGGIVITNVVENDVVNGRPAVLGALGNSTLSANGTWPVGITLDTVSGNIIVANGTAPGTYAVTYQLCDKLTPQTCALMVDQITVRASCDLSILKTVDNLTPITGTNVVFKLTAVNNGPSSANGVKVTDMLPAGYTYVSDDSKGSYVVGTGLWTVGALKKGVSAVINIKVLVNTTGSYSNIAIISGTENDPVSGNNTSTSTPVPVLSNLNPVAKDDSTSTNENIAVSYNVATNDIPGIRGGNVWKTVTNPNHGLLTFYPDGSFTYLPDMNFNGIDTFTYSITDVSGANSIATVTIEVMATPIVELKANKPFMNNDGTFHLRYTLTIINNTGKAIDSIQVTDNLDEVFKSKGFAFEITGLKASGSLLSNGLYDGSSIISLLTEGKSMASGVQDTITFELNVNTHNQQDSVSVLNQALFTAYLARRKLSMLTDADITTRPWDPTLTNLPAVDLFIPEGFSPNDDSYNDKFVITHSIGVKVDFEVFNRWGNSVYKSNDYRNDWDGKGTGNFLGKDLPTGTYYCIYVVTNSKTGEIVSKGEKYITLRR